MIQQSNALEMDEKKKEVLDLYEARKEFEYERRLLREEKMRQRAHAVRAKALKNWATTIQNRIKDSATERSAASQQPTATASSLPLTRSTLSKVALKKIRIHRMKSYNKMNEKKDDAAAERTTRQSRQFCNLANLKTELDRQKQVLWAENRERKLRRERKRKERGKIRLEMIQAGENPYLIDRVITLAEIQKREQDKEGVSPSPEQGTIKKVANELVEVENSKEKERCRRLKWDKFWEKKAKEKRRLKAEADKKYLDLDGRRPNWTERLDTAIDDFSDRQNEIDIFNIDLIMEENGITSWRTRQERVEAMMDFGEGDGADELPLIPLSRSKSRSRNMYTAAGDGRSGSGPGSRKSLPSPRLGSLPFRPFDLDEDEEKGDEEGVPFSVSIPEVGGRRASDRKSGSTQQSRRSTSVEPKDKSSFRALPEKVIFKVKNHFRILYSNGNTNFRNSKVNLM